MFASVSYLFKRKAGKIKMQELTEYMTGQEKQYPVIR